MKARVKKSFRCKILPPQLVMRTFMLVYILFIYSLNFSRLNSVYVISSIYKNIFIYFTNKIIVTIVLPPNMCFGQFVSYS